MNPTNPHNFASRNPAAMAAAVLLACAAAMLGGCKNSSSAASPDPAIGKPPSVRAQLAKTDLQNADPLQSAAWQNATWTNFVPPINTGAATPPTRGAVLYDAANLYVAVVCQKPPAGGLRRGDEAPVVTEWTDTVSLYLDPHGDGRELLQVSVDASPAPPRCLWFRATSAAQPRDDGSPDRAFPIDSFPLQNPDIWCVLREATDRGSDVWTATFGIPLATLPGPLRATPAPGTAWRFNLLRTITAAGRRVPQLQSNLSPVFVGAQPVSPYRLANLEFAP